MKALLKNIKKVEEKPNYISKSINMRGNDPGHGGLDSIIISLYRGNEALYKITRVMDGIKRKKPTKKPAAKRLEWNEFFNFSELMELRAIILRKKYMDFLKSDLSFKIKHMLAYIYFMPQMKESFLNLIDSMTMTQ